MNRGPGEYVCERNEVDRGEHGRDRAYSGEGVMEVGQHLAQDRIRGHLKIAE